ncbi:MAG: aminoacetone oxidase family FAD-binding enzyme [Clostridia bacterium]|nr:aminoacetone oxidase family FAD-binding enzyme [Clostridia bacterium]
MDRYKVAIIGAGAAGCACASRLIDAGLGAKIVMIEKGDRICRKVAASGNGQGNISNADMGPEHYFGSVVYQVSKFDILSEYSPEKFFGVKTYTDEKGRIYPYSRQASCIGDIFRKKIEGSGAELVLGDGAVRIKNDEGGRFIVTLSSGRRIRADFAVVATGGEAAPQFGTDGSAYSLTAGFVRRFQRTYPSLVQLKTDTADIKGLKGIRVDCGVAAYDDECLMKEYRGDVIFTDYGVSGNAIFYISAYVTDIAWKREVTLRLDLSPDFTEEELRAYFADKRAAGCDEALLMSGLLHNRVAGNVAARAAKEKLPLERVIKNFTLRVTGSLGFDSAQVTKGGISAEDVTGELECAHARNLYFAGEILDADGECGGYNLHFAFSCGIRVAKSIINRSYE